jgi:hypothetical protein
VTPQRQTIFTADHPKGYGNCQSAAMASVLDLPIAEVIDTTSDEVRDNGFWKPISDWLKARGMKMVNVNPSNPLLVGAYSIGYGKSPRGNFNHAVVCKNGVMVFDPHPSDDGVVELNNHDIIMPIGAE